MVAMMLGSKRERENGGQWDDEALRPPRGGI